MKRILYRKLIAVTSVGLCLSLSGCGLLGKAACYGIDACSGKTVKEYQGATCDSPTKKVYYVGDKLDLTGFKVYVCYTNARGDSWKQSVEEFSTNPKNGYVFKDSDVSINYTITVVGKDPIYNKEYTWRFPVIEEVKRKA